MFNLFMIKIKKRFIKKIKIEERKLVDEAGKVRWNGEQGSFFVFIYVTHVNSHFLCTYTLKIIYINLHTTYKKKLHNPDDIRHSCFFLLLYFFGIWHKFFNHFVGIIHGLCQFFNNCNVLFHFNLKPQCFMIMIKIRLKFFNDWCQDLIENLNIFEIEFMSLCIMVMVMIMNS